MSFHKSENMLSLRVSHDLFDRYAGLLSRITFSIKLMLLNIFWRYQVQFSFFFFWENSLLFTLIFILFLSHIFIYNNNLFNRARNTFSLSPIISFFFSLTLSHSCFEYSNWQMQSIQITHRCYFYKEFCSFW